MFRRVIKLSLFFVGLFINDIVFGMENNVPFLTKDVVKNCIMPQCSFLDQLNLRASCKGFKTPCTQFILNGASFDDTFEKIYNAYNKISPSCAFLDCVQKGKHKKVKWFLESGMYKTLFTIVNSRYFSIHPLTLIKSDDIEMKNLFKNYNEKSFYDSIIDAQKKYCTVSLKQAVEDWDSASDILNKEGNPIDVNALNAQFYTEQNMSAKEFYSVILCAMVKTYPYYNELIMSACTGDIECFDKAMKNFNTNRDSNKLLNLEEYGSINLVLQIAVKNKNMNFISNLLKDKIFAFPDDNYEFYGMLSSFLLKTSVEKMGDVIITKDEYFNRSHIDFIKKLIVETNLFKKMSVFIKNNKDNNIYVKEIYDALNTKLEKQRIKKQNSLTLFDTTCFQQ